MSSVFMRAYYAILLPNILTLLCVAASNFLNSYTKQNCLLCTRTMNVFIKPMKNNQFQGYLKQNTCIMSLTRRTLPSILGLTPP